MLSNCVVGEDSWESLGLKEINPKGYQSWIFIGRTDAETEVPILCHLMRRDDSLEKTLMLGKIEGRRRGQGIRWLDGITDSMDMNLSKIWEMVKDREDWHAAVHGIRKSWTQQSNWITTAITLHSLSVSQHSLLNDSCLAVYLENLENEPLNSYHIFGNLEFYTVKVDRWERKEYFSRRN